MVNIWIQTCNRLYHIPTFLIGFTDDSTLPFNFSFALNYLKFGVHGRLKNQENEAVM